MHNTTRYFGILLVSLGLVFTLTAAGCGDELGDLDGVADEGAFAGQAAATGRLIKVPGTYGFLYRGSALDRTNCSYRLSRYRSQAKYDDPTGHFFRHSAGCSAGRSRFCQRIDDVECCIDLEERTGKLKLFRMLDKNSRSQCLTYEASTTSTPRYWTILDNQAGLKVKNTYSATVGTRVAIAGAVDDLCLYRGSSKVAGPFYSFYRIRKARCASAYNYRGLFFWDRHRCDGGNLRLCVKSNGFPYCAEINNNNQLILAPRRAGADDAQCWQNKLIDTDKHAISSNQSGRVANWAKIVIYDY